MLTPMDIQQKRFRVGIGFEKKDVTTFFDSVNESYEKLYRSNAELKEKVNELEDRLQHYKTKEKTLEKSIMLAEKDSEDRKSKANREAKNIELDAKNKAKIIVSEAEERLHEIEKEIEILQTQYATYKSSFASLLKTHLTHLGEEDFDTDSFIDPKYADLFMGGFISKNQTATSSSSFEFNGDPQMRDESPLGGAASGGYGMSTNPEAKATSSEVYTSLLKDNKNFVDPFNTDKQQTGRYNPYDGRTSKPKKNENSAQPTFTVASKDKNKVKFTSQSVDSNVRTAAKDIKTPVDETSLDEMLKQERIRDLEEKARKQREADLIARKAEMEAKAAEKARILEQQKERARKDAEAKAKAAEEARIAAKLAEAEARFAEEARIAKAAEEARIAEEAAKYKYENEFDADFVDDVNDDVVDMEKSTESFEDDIFKSKAREFFRKSTKEDEYSVDDEMSDEQLVGEVEDEKIKKKFLIGDEDESDGDFEFF